MSKDCIAKSIRSKNSQNTFNLIILFVIELKKMEVEGFGVYVDKTTMEVDKLFPAKNCFPAFVKKDLLDMPDKFFEYATASECTKEMYILNYDKSIDTCLKKVAAVYHPDKHRLTITLESNMSDSNFFFYLIKYSIEVFIRCYGC